MLFPLILTGLWQKHKLPLPTSLREEE